MSSKFFDTLFGYERSEESFNKSKSSSAVRHFKAKLIGGMNTSFAKKVLTNPISLFINKLNRSLASTPIKTFGAMLLSFGLVTLLINFANYYFNDLPSSPQKALIIGTVFTVIAIPLMFTEAPLVEFFEKWKFTDILLFDILCLKRVRKKDFTPQAFTWGAPFLIGTVISIVGFFFPLEYVLLSIAGLIFLALSFASPEFSFMMTLLLLPLIPLTPYPTVVICTLVGITFISFFAKVFVGKRLYHYEQYDLVLILFLLFILISGIFNKGVESFGRAAALTVLALSYFVASNIIVNRRLADNAVNIIIFSSIPTAIYGIIDYTVSEINPAWLDPAFTTPRAVATFGNPNIYAAFLLVTTIFSLVFAKDAGKHKYLPYYIIVATLNLAALVLTWTRGAWLAIIISVLAFAIIRSRRTPKILLIPAILIPILVLWIPDSVRERFLSILNLQDTSIASRLSIWRSSLSMFLDNMFIGVGVGEAAFKDEFLKYAEDSVTAPHSHNLFLEIGIEAGIFALILFVMLLLVRISHRATYAKYVRNSSVDSLCTISGTALFAMLAYGMTDYIWYSYTIYALFFIVFGIGSATLRISKTEYDEAILERTADYSDYQAVSNITITKNS